MSFTLPVPTPNKKLSFIISIEDFHIMIRSAVLSAEFFFMSSLCSIAFFAEIRRMADLGRVFMAINNRRKIYKKDNAAVKYSFF
jgi:hypothetical protein